MSQQPENPILNLFLKNINKPINTPLSEEQLAQYGDRCQYLQYNFQKLEISSPYFLTENPPQRETLFPFAYMGIFSQERALFGENNPHVPSQELDQETILIRMRNLPTLPNRFENDGNIDDIVLAAQGEELLGAQGLPTIMTSLIWRPATSEVLPMLFTVNGISPATAREIAIGHAQRALDLRFGK